MRTLKFALLAITLGAGCTVRTGPGNNPGPGPGPGSLAFYWSFGNGLDCTASSVVRVDVSVDGTPATSVDCIGSNGVQGIQVNDFQAGSHSYDILAYRLNDTTVIYEQHGFATAVADQLVQVQVDLLQQVGDLTVDLTFQNSPSNQTAYDCATRGVVAVSYELDNSSNQVVYTTTQSGPAACGPLSFHDLPLGNYTFYNIQGLGQSSPSGAYFTLNEGCGLTLTHAGDETESVALPYSNGSSACPQH